MYLLNFLPSILLGSNLSHFNVLCYYPPLKTYLAMRFGKGWVAFWKDNNLEEGDVGVFEVIERKLVVPSVSILHVVDHQSSD